MSFWDFANENPLWALMFFLGGFFIFSVLVTTLFNIINREKKPKP